MKTNKLPPIHPGEILREEFMKPRGLSQEPVDELPAGRSGGYQRRSNS